MSEYDLKSVSWLFSFEYMVSIFDYGQILFGKIHHGGVRENAKELLSAMFTEGTTQIWTLSEDSSKYERFKHLLDGSLKNSLTLEMTTEALLSRSLEAITFKKRLYVIHDGTNLLKPESHVQPDLHKVRDLTGKLVNGYTSFCSICVNDHDKEIHLLQCTPYTTNPKSGFNQSLVGFTEKELIEGHIRNVDKALKERFSSVEIVHLLDRKHDDLFYFSLFKELGSHFVIRGKLNRNSNEIMVTETETETEKEAKPKAVKLVNATLIATQDRYLEQFVWKGKCYREAKLVSTYGTLMLDGVLCYVVKMQVYEKSGRKIFSEPMLLITNQIVDSHEIAFEIYQQYLIRSKIEGVFKFLKQEMGWEDFRIKDFMAIQNIIVLCFFVAEYFYENEKKLVEDKSAQIICQLAKSKGKVTPHFYKKGLSIIANYILFKTYIEENNLSENDIQDLIATFTE